MRRRLIVAALLVGALLALLWAGLSARPDAQEAPPLRSASDERRAVPRPGASRERTGGVTDPRPPLDAGAAEAEGVLEVEVLAAERPLPGASVRLYWRERRDPNLGELIWRLAGTGLTDARGQARLASGPGSYLVAVHANGHAPQVLSVVRPHGVARTSVRLVLEPGQSLVGQTVVKGTKEPLPLVQLVLSAVPRDLAPGIPPELPSEERVYATSDERGRFRVDGLATGDYLLEAQAPGHAHLWLVPVKLPAKEPLEVALSVAGVIEGFVVDARGAPAEGAEVRVSGVSPQSVTTGPGGGFSVEVEAGTYGLSARHGEEAGALEQPLTLSAGKTIRGVRLQLGPGSVLEGRVLERTSGAPVVGARVDVSPHGQNGDTGRESTDGTGHFQVGGLAPGSYDVVVTAPGFTPALRRGLTVTPRERFSVDLVLTRMGVVEGQVRDVAGQPVEGARVIAPNLGPEELESTPLESRSDATGHYRLEGLNVGRQPLIARREEATQGVNRWVDITEEGTAQVDFTLEGTGIVEGVVRAARGALPSQPLEVLASLDEKSPFGAQDFQQAEVGAKGNFRMVLPAGGYELLLSARDHSPTFQRTHVQVEEGQTVRVELLWEENAPASSVEGVVLEPDGAPSPRATVTLGLEPQEGGMIQAKYTDEEGRFSFGLGPDMEPGMGGLKVSALNGGRSGQVSGVKPGERSLVVRLRAAASLRGRVTRAGEPVRGFTLGIEPEGEEWLTQGKGPWEFPGERFELHDVMTEPLRLVVKTPDGSRGQAVVTPRPGATAEVELRLRGTASVQGRVVDAATGGPLSDVVVFIDNDPSSVHMRESLDQGRFSISGLDPGEYVLNILGRHTSGRLRLPLRLAEGEVLDLGDLSLGGTPGGTGSETSPPAR
ncbi:carboxypeptidase regulatory-like domain-containing protein [Cystobacter fuscus]|uniref:carboxypeptidase regulatory-like domain-containing protein n=1 Tax=Cystobacter fuscus TaxID=43 RepID=UPI002B2B8E26|nr:carboxypeptidase regulatory-like domain-containing protein [Cystobacter fuscus]